MSRSVGAPSQPVPRRSFAACPYLPAGRPGLDWRALHAFRSGAREAAFYLTCLEYAQTLWQQGLAARALLCLDRAMGADLRGPEPILAAHPMPYRAMAWLVAHTPADVFLGNPRVHFQHYADRLGEPRREPRRWRAWACWGLVRVVRPDLPADPRHAVHEPSEAEIYAGLVAHALPGEAQSWATLRLELRGASALPPPSPLGSAGADREKLEGHR